MSTPLTALTPGAPQDVGAARTYVFPPSYAQRRMWFIQQMEPDSAIYNVPYSLRLVGELDRGGLERSLAEIVRRHESLRTTFPTRDDEPVQQIHPAGAVGLPLIDLSGLGEPLRTAVAQAVRRSEGATAFDLASAPAVRFRLVRLGRQAHELLITLHHIISDGRSRSVLTDELGVLYGAFRQGRPSPLPEPEIQLADFSVWQRELLQGAVVEQQLAYWSKRLAQVPTLELPTDFVRTPNARRPAAVVPVAVSRELNARLNELGGREGATPFMLLLAAFQWLLGLHAGQDDVAVGTVISSRHRKETEGLIGFLVNTVVMRADLRGSPSFRDLVVQVRRLTGEAFANRDLPFERLVEALNPERVLGRTPLFQAAFAVETGSSSAPALAGLQVEELAGGESQQGKFEIMLVLQQTEAGLHGELEYAADLYRHESMQRFARHFERLLEAVVADPGARLDALSLLSAEDRACLADWNRTARPFPGQGGIHELFEEQVARRPEAVAVAHAGARLTYADLERQAERLAGWLRAHGIGPEARVGLCVERGLDMAVGMLAILKAGAAYVPLDPSYPAERLAYMVADVQARVVLVQQALQASFDGLDVETVCLEEVTAELAHLDSAKGPSAGAGNSLAYVMYTSGSTGAPKGIMVTHQAIARLVRDTDYVSLGPDDRVAQVANISFDAATFEIWGALLNGATLVIIDRETALSPVDLAEAFRREGISVTFLTTALFNQVVRETTRAFEGLRHVLFGGEAVDPRWVRTALADGGAERLLHVYGPTETTTFATWFHVREVDAPQQTVPIGRPLANTCAHVLDRDLMSVPPGVPGELYVGGPGVARGYWNRPGLTAERFVPDPFAAEPGARLYRTGDKVRRRGDGSLEFLGRFDHLIKLRGYRIELGEIEACLRQHEAVQDAVVVLRDDDGDQRLVAYLVGRPGALLRAGEAKESLRRRLPEYMLPAALVVLDALPLNANGKVDRRALPEPFDEQLEAREYEAPRTELERVLCTIWAETLKLERVGVSDNFFEIGGHSLLATRVMSRIRAELDATLPLRALFEFPTVAQLAAQLGGPARDDTPAVPAIPRADRTQVLPLSPAQRRLWFLQQLELDSGAYNVPAFLRLGGELDRAALSWSWSEIVRRHEALRTSFPARRGEPQQEIQPAQPVSIPLVDLSALAPAVRAALAGELRQQAADRPFDLGQAPVWRVCLLCLQAREHELLLVVHHVVTDGWSEGILVGELRALYAARRAGRPAPLPELPIQYADYAVWQHAWLEEGALSQQVQHWRQRLDGVAVLDIPTDHARLPVASHPQAIRPIHLSAGLTQALKGLGQQEGATLFMALLAGLQWLLSRYGRQRDIAVGTVVANRGRREVEGLIGFFVNTLVLRVDVGEAPTFRKLVRQAREVALDAFAHQDVPFEKLVEELRPDRDLGRTPFFQALLVLQNAPVGAWDLAGLRVEDIEVELHDAKFELNLSLIETANGLEGRLSYMADLFEAETIDQLLRHYTRLLEGAVAQPDAPLPTLPLLAPEERRQVLVEWNSTAKARPSEGLVVELLAEWARRTPQATAVDCEGTRLGFGELEPRANRLARHLVQRGLGPQGRVAVCLERGLDWAVAVLAVWKADGVYVPLDPAYPHERLAFMLADSGATVVVTDQALRDELPPHPATVCLDLEWEAIEGQAGDSVVPRLGPDSLAYVMYTSGSTGRPKGVMIEHRGLLNHLWGKIEALGLGAGDCVAQNATASFDISVWQLLAVLLVGGRVQIFGDDVSRDAFQLLGEVEQWGVTVMETVPSLLATMVAEQERLGDGRQALARLRCLISNAEALPVALCERWLGLYPHVQLINTYGATECSDDVTHHTVQTGAARSSAYAPLGTPLGNLTVYVLDDDLQPVPFGAPGELCLGGVGVGRGYLNRPDLTAERFVPDPFGATPGQRLYRTGDLGRLKRDRTLEFLGRIDFQVKVRGHRVELGEIEDALLEHDGVSQAVVLLREDDAGDPRLAAYVVPGPTTDRERLPRELGEFLAARLPEYMVPAAFVTLDAMPLTVNGKVDRRALPAPEGGASRADTYVAPSNAIETMLCGLWQQLLRVAQVGVHDNFFGLGGHSLLATQVVARVRSALQVEVPLAAVFRAPTVAAFALEIERARESKQPERIVAADRAAFRARA